MGQIPAVGAAIEIKVLGGFTVLHGGSPIAMPPSRKTRALLAYLAVERRPHRRERLCELFWGIPDDPRGALRWSLSKLRQIFPADERHLLRSDRNVVELAADGIELDYDQILAIPSAALAALPTDRLEALAGAFTGSFLEDLAVSRCPEFDAWRTYHANHAEMMRLKLLQTLVDRLENDPQRALTHLHVLQTLLPEEDLTSKARALQQRAQAAIAKPVRLTVVSPPAGEPGPAPALAFAPDADARTVSRQAVHFCRAPDGTRLAYAVDGRGPAIVRTAHWMSHIELERQGPVWRHWLDLMTDRFSLLRYDERLNGLSAQQADDVSFETLVADLEAVVEAASPGPRFVLLGISQGCPVAIEYAARYPERVAGLILHGGFVRGWRVRGDASELARREAMQVLIREGWGQNHPAFRQLFTSLFIPGASPEQMEWFNEVQRRTVTPDNASRLSEVFSQIDVAERLSELRAPTLVLHARDDRIAPFSEGLELAERIPEAEIIALESQNHLLLPGEPEFQRFFGELTRFTEKVFARSASSGELRRRHQASILCAEVITPAQVLGDVEAALDLLDPLLDAAVAHLHTEGASILELTDSRVVASFAEGSGNHALVACRVALELRDLLRLGSRNLGRVRIAVDTGTVFATPARLPSARADVELRGAPLNTAKSVNGSLRRELVVITERTHDRTRDAITARPVTRQDLVGASSSEHLFELTGVTSRNAGT